MLTQASIYDFQPLVTSGETPPPANPLTVSQPCIRMQDIDNVGKTGRHTMAFEMMAHHAFNAQEEVGDAYAYEGEVYWKSRTVELCDELLESLGADITDVTYIEDPWVGGGNAGPAIEVIYRGLELATLVFMCMEQDPDGEYELKDGNTYSFMDTYIVDTGYGLERWTWMSQGTPTVYEAIYPEMIAFLRDNAGISHRRRVGTRRPCRPPLRQSGHRRRRRCRGCPWRHRRSAGRLRRRTARPRRALRGRLRHRRPLSHPRVHAR